jgi:hypothetical protein
VKRLLIGFGIIYGELSAMVVLVVFSQLWWGSKQGEQTCSSLGWELLTCRALSGAVIVVLCSLATVLSFRTFVRSGREQERQAPTQAGEPDASKEKES